jgi:pimeloyl-ACP methyl ester carboxylesterase
MTPSPALTADPSARWLLRRRQGSGKLYLLGHLFPLYLLACCLGLLAPQIARAQYAGFNAATSAESALGQARELDRAGDERAVDLYFQAAAQAASVLSPNPASGADGDPIPQVYHDALSGLLDAGQRYGRLDPRSQLTIMTTSGARSVPLRYHGFAWKPRDFSRLSPAAAHTSREIKRRHVQPGLGVTLVVERISSVDEPFFREWQPFAATALLRPAFDSAAAGGYVLELYNPFVIRSVQWHGVPCLLAGDLSAPLAALASEVPRTYLEGFTAPTDVSVHPKLFMLEPCQPGKIPVVFIHGLYSDAVTWAAMINDLRSQPDLYARYQFWTYRYPTGGDLLTSTAALRRNLQLAQAMCNPQGTDAAMNSMVLVGHSLGGLVSKTQVTTSYDILWNAAATQPFSNLRATPEMQERLSRGFFFEPSPHIRRVIFIGTPHRGSGMASRAAGRVGAALVRFSGEEHTAFMELLEQNPGLFKPAIQRQRPTSVAMLEPDNPYLEALGQMPVSSRVRLHSIIGTGGLNPTEPGDGIVPIASARHPGDSELFVRAHHEKLHQVPDTIAEVARILRLNAAEVGQ